MAVICTFTVPLFWDLKMSSGCSLIKTCQPLHEQRWWFLSLIAKCFELLHGALWGRKGNIDVLEMGSRGRDEEGSEALGGG